MRIAILSKPGNEEAALKAAELAEYLQVRGHTLALDAETAASAGLPGGLPRESVGEGADLAVVLGGDGTLLLGARVFSPHGVPIFGVNMGRLGFLTDTGPDHMFEVLDQVLAGEHTVEERLMLSAEVIRADGSIEGPLEAFNDIVVNKGALAQVIRIETRWTATSSAATSRTGSS